MARFLCPSCGAIYRVDDAKLTQIQKVKCQKCHTPFLWREHLINSPSAQPLLPSEEHEESKSSAPSSGGQFTPGTTLNKRYKIGHVLGEGGMGITYKALDLHTQRPVVLKLLRLSRMEDWKTLELFERETKILKQLSHPQIPKYLDSFSVEQESDVWFVQVQEYIDGRSLQQLVEAGKQGTEEDALAIIGQVADILGYLHGFQPPVIHRDITPKNILIAPDKTVYLVDFGAVQEKIRTTFFAEATVVGTCGYAPFEQFTGQTVPASDYYALGATLLFMLTGKHPADFSMQNLKPQFQEELQVSLNTLRLLNGLLEPDAKKRPASPERIRKILTTVHTDRTAEFAVYLEEPVKKPADSKIEKILEGSDRIIFKIPQKSEENLPVTKRPVSSLVQKVFKKIHAPDSEEEAVIVLEFSPEWINFQDKWSVPSRKINCSDLTWYFEKNIPVFGIHYQETLLCVKANLTQTEIEWLMFELADYLAKLPKADTPSKIPPIPPKSVLSSTLSDVRAKLFPMPQLNVSREKNRKIQCRIPVDKMMLGFAPFLGFLVVIFLGVMLSIILEEVFNRQFSASFLTPVIALTSVFMFLGAEKIEQKRMVLLNITPEHICAKSKILRWKYEQIPLIPLSNIRKKDIQPYFKEVSSGENSILKMVIGINYQKKTFLIDNLKLDDVEVRQLIQNIRGWVAEFQNHSNGGSHTA